MQAHKREIPQCKRKGVSSQYDVALYQAQLDFCSFSAPYVPEVPWRSVQPVHLYSLAVLVTLRNNVSGISVGERMRVRWK